VSILLRDEIATTRAARAHSGAPAPVNQLVESFVGALDFLAEDGVAVRLCLDCDRWTTVPDDQGLIEGLLLGLTLRACDRMPQGGLLSLETALLKLDENSFEETGLPPGEYVRVSVSDTGGWSDSAKTAWTTRMGSPRRLERPSLAALCHTAEMVGGALACARHASCGERANLYLPALRRHVRPVLDLA
jgi:hypothetical protein